MDILLVILAFLFGTVIGSFLNVVSLRMRSGKGLGGRSMCMSCGKELHWSELVPILSFIFLRGACAKCRSRISWQYPTVEFLAGAIFVLIFVTFPPITFPAALTTLLQLIIAAILIVITVYDMKHKIIPDLLVFLFGLAALISLFVGGNSWWHIPGFEALIAGPFLAIPFALIWVVSGGRWMGLGDAKLTLGIGWLLGIDAGINAMILAFWTGAVMSVLWLFYTYGRFRPKTEIPFGPFLILGMYLVLIFHIEIIDVGLVRDILMSFYP